MSSKKGLRKVQLQTDDGYADISPEEKAFLTKFEKLVKSAPKTLCCVSGFSGDNSYTFFRPPINKTVEDHGDIGKIIISIEAPFSVDGGDPVIQESIPMYHSMNPLTRYNHAKHSKFPTVEKAYNPEFKIGQSVILNNLHGCNAIDYKDIAVGAKFRVEDSSWDDEEQENIYMITPIGKGKDLIPTLTGVLESDLEKFQRKSK